MDIFGSPGFTLTRRRRRRLQSTTCDPQFFIIPNNPDSNFMEWNDNLFYTNTHNTIPWPICSGYDINTGVATSNCYVWSHDASQTTCACTTSQEMISVSSYNWDPPFYATLGRNNPPFTWDGLMTSVLAPLWMLLLCFVFTFAMYLLPTYDKHKAFLAVKKGLPRSERNTQYFRTADGKSYAVIHSRASFAERYQKLFEIRLRNDHLCLWWCYDDPGSNISHKMKVLLTAMYTLLFCFLLAIFYANEDETRFSDVFYAFLIAFLTILPIWLLSWCISLIRPHDWTEQDFDEIIEDRMPFDTKDNRWDDEYSSEDEGGYNEYDENDDGTGLFAIPQRGGISKFMFFFVHFFKIVFFKIFHFFSKFLIFFF